MITEIAWKNVWRNKPRSLIVIAAITVGVFAGVFSIAIMNSAIVQRIDASVNEELAHIQVNNKDFRNSSDIKSIIPDYNQVVSEMMSAPGMKEVSGRIIIRGIASTSARSTGVEISGINVEKERRMLKLADKIIPGTGTFFESETRFNRAYIGEKLAKELNIIRYNLDEEALSRLREKGVPEKIISGLEPIYGERFTSGRKLQKAVENLLGEKDYKKFINPVMEAAWSYREGSRIILTFVDINNIQTGAAFRISGIFRTNNDMFEETSVFVPEEELRKLTGLKDNDYHRVIGLLDENSFTEEATSEIREALNSYEVLNWKEIQPDLAMFADMMQQIYGLFMAIILAALAFGIVNTMLMSVLERTKEIGMLAAIGMNRRRIFIMIMLESIFLSIVGGLSGMAVGGTVIALTAKKGINLMQYSEGFEAMGYSAHLFPAIDTNFFIITTILIVLTGILSSMYPARKALQLNPVEAIRTE